MVYYFKSSAVESYDPLKLFVNCYKAFRLRVILFLGESFQSYWDNDLYSSCLQRDIKFRILRVRVVVILRIAIQGSVPW